MTLTTRVPDAARPHGGALTVSVVPGGDDAALDLFARQQAELAARYGGPDTATFDPAEVLAALVARVDGEPVACVALRDVSATPDGVGGRHPASTGEVKRLFVDAESRGRGYARVVMQALHEHALAIGLRRLVLETGTLQPESIDLYLALGYVPTAPYGHHADDPRTRCFALDLAAARLAVSSPPGRTGRPGDGPTPGPDLRLGGSPATDPDLRLGGGERPAPPSRAGVPRAARRDLPVEVRATEWADPVAARLRREMHETSSAVLYPELVPGFDAAGGFEAVDVRLGERAVETLVAWRGDEPAGCASLQTPHLGAQDVFGDALEVKKVFVREEARRAGVARALMAAVEQVARRRGASVLLLETGIRQPGAIALYRALGFRSVLPFAPYDDSPLGIALCFAKPLR